MGKMYEADDLIKLFNKIDKKVEELSCFVKECCAKIPINIGTGEGIFKKFGQNKWQFKSLLAGKNISITSTNNEVVISADLECDQARDCIGIYNSGDPNKYLNQKGNWQTITIPPAFIESVSDTTNIDLTVTGTNLSADLTNTTVIPNTYGDASNIPQVTVDQKGRITSVTNIPITIPPNFIDSISDTSTINLTVTGTTLSADFVSTNISQFTNNIGYTTLSSFSAGTGISYNNLTGVITNSAPDQTVALASGTGISVTGTYPNFTITNTSPSLGGTVTSVQLASGTGISLSGTNPITTSGTITVTNSAPDQIVVLNSGTGISTSGTYPNFTITNTLPDQVVSLTQGGTTTITGSYPNFTISSADQYTGTVTSVQLSSGTGISLSGTNPITSSGIITITNSAPDQIVSIATTGSGLSASGTYPNFTLQNTLPDQTVVLTQGGTTTITGTYPNFTISSADQYNGTVTSVAALTLGTTGTDLSSSVANGTTTPVITLNVPTASATNRGALSSTDWSTFNNKVSSVSAGTNISITGTATNPIVNRLNSERRNDWQSPYSYCGTAPNGSAESSSVWTIYRIQVASDGTVTTLSATNVKWTDRYIVIYT